MTTWVAYLNDAWCMEVERCSYPWS